MARGRPSRQTVYNQLDEAIDDLRTRLGGLPSPAEAEQIWAELWHQEAHHSTALEGNTLILNEVRKLLEEGRAVGSKELKEYMEVIGYGAAAKWVYGQAMEPGDWTTGDLLNIQEVRTVHYEAMTPVWNVAPHPHATPAETPGNWRQHDIQPFPEGMTPPPFPEVDHRMSDWVAQVNRLREPDEIPSRSDWPRCTTSSSGSTRTSTATAARDDCCSTSCWFVWATHRPSSSRTNARSI